MNLHQKEKQMKNLFDDLEIYRKRRHSFANKKRMKRMTLAFIFVLSSLITQAQATLGLELSSLLYSEVKVAFMYRFAEHWSISADAGLNFKLLHRQISNEETEHNSQFPTNTLPESNAHMHRECLSICYWPQTALSGVFLSFGAEYRDISGVDACVGIGYMFKIWRGLHGIAKYDTGIIRAVKSEKLTLRDLNFGLTWIF